MSDLRKLIEAIVAGKADNFGAVGTPLMRGYAESAHEGSLDAAKKLQDVLLPGWGWKLESHGELNFAWVGHPNQMLFKQHSASFDNQARAWLLAILNAYEERP